MYDAFGKYYRNANLINFLAELKGFDNNKELIGNCSALKDVEILK